MRIRIFFDVLRVRWLDPEIHCCYFLIRLCVSLKCGDLCLDSNFRGELETVIDWRRVCMQGRYFIHTQT